MHDEEKQRGRLKKWYEIFLNAMENGYMSARRYAERTKLDASVSSNESIRFWMLGALKMMKKLKEHPQDDIRRHFNR